MSLSKIAAILCLTCLALACLFMAADIARVAWRDRDLTAAAGALLCITLVFASVGALALF